MSKGQQRLFLPVSYKVTWKPDHQLDQLEVLDNDWRSSDTARGQRRGGAGLVL